MLRQIKQNIKRLGSLSVARLGQGLTFCLILSFLFSPGDAVLAQGIGGAGENLDKVAGGEGAGFTESNISNIIGTGINAVLAMVGLIFLVLMVYAGILWMTARGDETKVEKAQSIIQASLIGLIITVSAYAITVFVTKRFQ